MGRGLTSPEERHHCPANDCAYCIGSEKYFTDKKLLKQHIAKVHAEKKYVCNKCQKRFGLDWYRKYHEETCGKIWQCDCGSQYTSRESLLTHARRNQHQLPQHILLSRKRKPSKTNLEQEKTLVIVVQPIIQSVACIQQRNTSVVAGRPILPKHTLVPSCLYTPVTVENVPMMPQQSKKTSLPLSGKVSRDVVLPEIRELNLKVESPTNNSFLKKCHLTAAAETQTSGDFKVRNISKKCYSQASQCTGRVPRLTGIESTHTQTTESTLVKIRKKNMHSKPRRKSIAITTDPNMASLWPGIKDCVFFESKLRTCSTSTQTSLCNLQKILCDSETSTDDDLMKFSWSNVHDVKKNVNRSPFASLSEGEAFAMPNILESRMDSFLLETTKAFCNEDSNLKTNPFPVGFDSHTKSEVILTDKITQSDIYTQTMLDYTNILANTETQTTDDFSFLDLEFLDTETQTWDDFPNIEDGTIPIDQLSIEIQTDFSSLDGNRRNQDPYELLNSVDIMTGCALKETRVIETQTQERLNFPQVTNSESQTLDLAQYLFE